MKRVLCLVLSQNIVVLWSRHACFALFKAPFGLIVNLCTSSEKRKFDFQLSLGLDHRTVNE